MGNDSYSGDLSLARKGPSSSYLVRKRDKRRKETDSEEGRRRGKKEAENTRVECEVRYRGNIRDVERRREEVMTVKLCAYYKQSAEDRRWKHERESTDKEEAG